MQMSKPPSHVCNDSTPPRDGSHAVLDEALLDLRRLWIHPRLLRWFSEQLGVGVELATLRTLRAIEAAGAGAGVGDLAAILAIDASTASRLVEQAVNDGYVQRRACSQDRRRSKLTLAPKGERLLAQSSRLRSELLGRATLSWSDEELAEAARICQRLQQDLRALIEEESRS